MNRITAKTVLLTMVFLADGSLLSTGAQENRTVYDSDIRVVHFEELKYPAIGRTALIEGVVVVQAKLSDDGNVLNATAISGPKLLIPDCLSNIRKWRFQPDSQQEAVVVYNFRLVEGIPSTGPSHFVLAPPNLATITAGLPPVEP